MNQISAYKQRTLETNKALQANLAAGGERRRQARHALDLADAYEYFHRSDNDHGRRMAMAHYLRYCEQIGYDPMVES